MGGWAAAIPAAVSLIGMGIAKGKDKRQLAQQEKLQQLSMKGSKEMIDYAKAKELEMWHDTGYGAQKAQMKGAGINPALMYGMGGGGAQTIGGMGATNVGMGDAPKGSGREAEEMLGMGMQLSLLKAQKENIEADTQNKLSQVPVNTATGEGKNLENALNALLQGTRPDGTNIETGEYNSATESTRAQEKISETKFTIDKNEREKLLNNEVIKEIGNKITLMGKQGLNVDEITENLKKEGKILDAEIEWNKMGLHQGDLGKFITALIHQLIKR